MRKITIAKDDAIIYVIFIYSVPSVLKMSQLSGRDSRESIGHIIFYF